MTERTITLTDARAYEIAIQNRDMLCLIAGILILSFVLALVFTPNDE